MGLVTLLYIALQVVAQSVLGPSLVGDATPLADAAGRLFGSWGVGLLSAGFMISAFGYLSGMMLAVPRALFAFARDGILPRQLAAVHPRFHTPWVAIIAQSALAWVLAVASGFERLAIIANVSASLVYLGCAAAAWKLRRTNVRQTDGAPFTIPAGSVAPVLAVVAILFLLSSVTAQEWGVLGMVVVVASLLYMVANRGVTHVP
jgi:amino acid transporter